MDLKQLEYIVAIAEYGNITKAAESLFISQSGLNQQLIKLEKELGIQLFNRNNHYLHMTKAGEIYVRNAREILQIQKNTYSELDDLKGNMTGEISLGLTHEHGIDLFTSIFRDFNARYPGYTFNLLEKIVVEQNSLLQKGDLDFALVMLGKADRADLEYLEIFTEPLVLGIPKAHPFADLAAGPGHPLTPIDLKLFKEEKFSLIFASSTMRSVIDPAFKAAGFRPQLLVETAMNHALVQLVSKNFCCTIIPQSRAMSSPYSSNCAWFTLTTPLYWDVCLAYRRNMRFNAAQQCFIKLAKAYGARMQEDLAKNIPLF
jgi:DNA-binding transcriptional LysR family regulator